jgi:hypothetical protein
MKQRVATPDSAKMGVDERKRPPLVRNSGGKNRED